MYKVQVQHKREQKHSEILVAAHSESRAELLARQAAPVPWRRYNVKAEQLTNLNYTGETPQVLCKL